MYRAVNRREQRALRKMKFWKRHKTLMDKPRLCVYRSNSHIQAQLINDREGKVIAAASSFEKELRDDAVSGKEMANKVGEVIAKRAKLAGVTTVVFDRNGFAYHGRVQALADAARSAGLNF
jgi:large subunit ribosomal protein L18